MQSIKDEMTSRKPLFNDILDLLTQYLTLSLLRITNVVTDYPSYVDRQKHIVKVLDYTTQFIESNYSKKIDINSLAQSAGYSYHRFRHIFQQTYKCSPKQYILKVRMNNAINMLRTTNESIESIANKCGFSSCPQFISTFRSITGLTPLQFRKNCDKDAHFLNE